MYTPAYDREQALLFAFWSGPSNTEEDFERAAEDIVLLAREGAGHPVGVLHIAESEPENPTPNPMQRRRLTGAAQASLKSNGYYFCMVTQSPLVRGVVTALSWFAPRRDVFHNGCRATFEEALDWAEEYRPGVRARLQALRREAREAAGVPASAGEPSSPGR